MMTGLGFWNDWKDAVSTLFVVIQSTLEIYAGELDSR